MFVFILILDTFTTRFPTRLRKPIKFQARKGDENK